MEGKAYSTNCKFTELISGTSLKIFHVSKLMIIFWTISPFRNMSHQVILRSTRGVLSLENVQ